MNYIVQIKRLSDDVEQEVVLRIKNFKITCFAAACPYKIEEGEFYRVSLTTQVLNDYHIDEVDEEVPSSLVQIGNGFSYIITGRLTNNCLDVDGIFFEDDMLLSNFGYLEGKMITWKVDRIDVEFLLGDSTE